MLCCRLCCLCSAQPVSTILDGHSCVCHGSKVTQSALAVCWGAAFLSGAPKKGLLMCLWQLDGNIAKQPGDGSCCASAPFILRLSTLVHSLILLMLPQKRKQQISVLLFLCSLFHGNSLSSLYCFTFPCHVAELQAKWTFSTRMSVTSWVTGSLQGFKSVFLGVWTDPVAAIKRERRQTLESQQSWAADFKLTVMKAGTSDVFIMPKLYGIAGWCRRKTVVPEYCHVEEIQLWAFSVMVWKTEKHSYEFVIQNWLL